MKKIVIIEDDQIVANIYRNKLAVDGFQVEIAGDGESGLELIKKLHPDILLLDLMLPKISGVELLKKIRSEPDFREMPIIVFSSTYLSNVVQDAWKAGATKCLSKANCTPKQVIEMMRNTLGLNGATTTAMPPRSDAQAPAGKAAVKTQPVPASASAQSRDSDAEFQSGLRQSFREGLPALLAHLRLLLQGLIKADNEPAQVKQLSEMYQRIRALTGNAGITSVPQIARMSDALEALLKELHDKPKTINASSLRTVASAVDFLGILFERGFRVESAEAGPPAVLVVDDEAISHRAVAYALEKAKLKSVSVEDPDAAYDLLAENHFDLILLDVDMPGMNGFELCTKLRQLPAHKKTPVIFVTVLADFESRANSTMSGGNDFIAKPFLFMELSVKALVHVLRARLPASKPGGD
jgi:DNA-binding response OmpR family regulator